MTRILPSLIIVALIGAGLVGATTAVGAVPAQDTRIVHDGEELTPAAGPNQTIQGQTDLPAGSTITVRLVSDDANSPFLREENTTVTDNGSFAVKVDLSPVDPGTEFNLTAKHDGRTLLNTTGTVVACDGECEELPPTPDGHDTTLHYTGERLTLAADANQTVRGKTTLEPGTGVTIRLQSNSPENPFLRMAHATVTENGSFETTVDLSEMVPETEFDVTVHHNGTVLTETTGIISSTCTDCDNSSVRSQASASSTTLVYDGDQPTFAAGPGQVIEGRTDIESGTVLTVQVRSDSPDNPFMTTDQVTVTEFGTFTTTANFSSMVPGTEATIVVSHNETVLLETTGAVVSCEGDCRDNTTTNSEAAIESSPPATSRATAGRWETVLGGSALLGAGLLSIGGLGFLLGVFRP